jgi:small subunit ribosomal protein S1
LFIELEEGIDGLVHVSDLSWTKKIKHPSEFTKVGERIDVVVLELDVENKRLALGHKQLEENPWDTFETIFTPHSVHKATVIQKTDKGAILELPYGLEGYVSLKNIVAEDGTTVDTGDSSDFRVLEFNKEDRRIVLTRNKINMPSQEEGDRKGKREGKKQDKVQNVESRSTLGDIQALSDLKEQMLEEGSKRLKSPKKAPRAKDLDAEE